MRKYTILWAQIWLSVVSCVYLPLAAAQGREDPFAVRLGLSRRAHQDGLRMEEWGDPAGEMQASEDLGRAISRIRDLISRQEFLSASRAIDAALANHEESIFLLYLGASVALRMEDFPRVVEHWERMPIEMLTPQQQFNASYFKGAALIRLSRFDEADVALHRAAALDPDHFSLRFSLLSLYAATGRDDRLRELAARLEYQDLSVYAGWLYEDFDDLTGALGEEGYIALASALASGGLKVERLSDAEIPAEAIPTDMLALDGGESSIRQQQSRLVEMRNQMRGLQRLFEQVGPQIVAEDFSAIGSLADRIRNSRLRLTAPAFWSMIDFVEYLDGDSAALDRLRDLHDQYPDQVVVLKFMLLGLWPQNENDEALQRARRTFEKQPASAEARALLASALAESEQYDHAIEALTRLQVEHPLFVERWFSQDNPYQQKIMQDDAFAAWRNALRSVAVELE